MSASSASLSHLVSSVSRARFRYAVTSSFHAGIFFGSAASCWRAAAIRCSAGVASLEMSVERDPTVLESEGACCTADGTWAESVCADAQTAAIAKTSQAERKIFIGILPEDLQLRRNSGPSMAGTEFRFVVVLVHRAGRGTALVSRRSIGVLAAGGGWLIAAA